METQRTGSLGAFSEKEFYLAEFRGRAVGLALNGPSPAVLDAIAPVLEDLDANGTCSVLVADSTGVLERLCGKSLVDASDPEWVGAVWHALGSSLRVGVRLGAGPQRAARVGEVALRLRLAKLVWLETGGGLERVGGGRHTYVDLAALDALLAASPASLDGERRELLQAIRATVAGGLPSVAICRPEALADELFTYAGAGTFFTRERYIEVRPLGIDEFSAAHALVRRGVEEGYLVDRGEPALRQVLANAFGVFVERRYLAGIGALLPHAASRAGELCSLYALTRFSGEGMGGHLVGFAMERARELAYDYVYACTTSERVERFFLAQGFSRVGPEAIPPEKWQGYPEERRALVRCLRRDCR